MAPSRAILSDSFKEGTVPESLVIGSLVSSGDWLELAQPQALRGNNTELGPRTIGNIVDFTGFRLTKDNIQYSRGGELRNPEAGGSSSMRSDEARVRSTPQSPW